MAKDSNIQWCDATWNIARGCTKVDEDCKFCYMYRESLNNTRYDPKTVKKTKTVFNLPLRLKTPSKIFTSSLTDFYHEDCDEFRNEAFEIMRRCPQHIFQILTKRPERIEANTPYDILQAENVWFGTSAGSKKGFMERVFLLASVNCKTRFVSVEPLYEQISMFPHLLNLTIEQRTGRAGSAIDWVIVGGESGNESGKYRYRPCKLEWIEEIVQDCLSYDVPVFVKQMGTLLSKELGMSDRHGGNIEEFPKHLQIRQFPN